MWRPLALAAAVAAAFPWRRLVARAVDIAPVGPPPPHRWTDVAPPHTFGNGLIVELNESGAPITMLDHRLGAGSAYGVVNHLWSTGEWVNHEVVVDYFVDGEETPSISLQLGMMAGQAYPLEDGGLGGSGMEPPYGLYSAGEKMGHGGQVGSWYSYHKVLFRSRVLVQARSLRGPQCTYMVLRGYEVAVSSPAAAGITMPSGYVVPARAKLQLQRIDNVTHRPLSFVPLFQLPPGYAGLLYLVTIATSTTPAGNDYIEGCWHLYTGADEQFPGVVLGTGFEDFFDSSYWFCSLQQQPCLHAHASSGLLFFSRTHHGNGSRLSPDELKQPRPYPADTFERLSAYRFFDQEQVGFSNGGSLEWRVGEAPGKCTDNSSSMLGSVNPTAVRSYAWAYTWPLSPSDPPAPNAPALRPATPLRMEEVQFRRASAAPAASAGAAARPRGLASVPSRLGRRSTPAAATGGGGTRPPAAGAHDLPLALVGIASAVLAVAVILHRRHSWPQDCSCYSQVECG